MLGELLRILAAAIITWLLFVSVDIFFRCRKRGRQWSVSCCEIFSCRRRHCRRHHDGNIVSSRRSAGTLLAACGVYVAGIPGGLIAAALVFIGNRICYDPGYAGTTGAVLATFVVYGFTQVGFAATDFIAGMVIAILSIQGLSHLHASRLLARLWRVRQ